jgi:hypothetical protein
MEHRGREIGGFVRLARFFDHAFERAARTDHTFQIRRQLADLLARHAEELAGIGAQFRKFALAKDLFHVGKEPVASIETVRHPGDDAVQRLKHHLGPFHDFGQPVLYLAERRQHHWHVGTIRCEIQRQQWRRGIFRHVEQQVRIPCHGIAEDLRTELSDQTLVGQLLNAFGTVAQRLNPIQK